MSDYDAIVPVRRTVWTSDRKRGRDLVIARPHYQSEES